jgi:hypothetical protein
MKIPTSVLKRASELLLATAADWRQSETNMSGPNIGQIDDKDFLAEIEELERIAGCLAESCAPSEIEPKVPQLVFADGSIPADSKAWPIGGFSVSTQGCDKFSVQPAAEGTSRTDEVEREIGIAWFGIRDPLGRAHDSAAKYRELARTLERELAEARLNEADAWLAQSHAATERDQLQAALAAAARDEREIFSAWVAARMELGMSEGCAQVVVQKDILDYRARAGKAS